MRPNTPDPRTTWTQAVAALELARRDALEDVDSDDEMMLLGGAHITARDAVLFMPAPDLESVGHKVEVILAEEYDLDQAIREYLDCIVADIRRLTSGDAR